MKSVPKHLSRYVVSQDYERYTPEDQAVWRFIMRQLKAFLGQHAHPCYLDGLEKTGLSSEEIPNIDHMNEKLQEFGWGAVPVSGFIPPAAFMEFQSLGFLPIASDMRSIDHILYTPAPDIVHEAAGHAPILIDPDFALYLKNYAEVASKAIITREDLDLYEAIRVLSDVKENPSSTVEEIEKCEQTLKRTVENMTSVSEASFLSRMNWWTAEYGLIGDLENPKIFGAGLLSSVGESESCLTKAVKKIPLSVSCIDYSYDITERQPQLFVTPDFNTLSTVLEELSEKMSYKKGGLFGLNMAQEAKTINTVELDSGLQISGQLSDYLEVNGEALYLRFTGPTQISYAYSQLKGHGIDYHATGYSTPLGPYQTSSPESHWKPDQQVTIKFDSGIQLAGDFIGTTKVDDSSLMYSFNNCTVSHGDNVLFEPEWGTFDLALGQSIPSVFGGPADRAAFGEFETFSAKKISPRSLSDRQIKLNKLYSRIRENRSSNKKLEEKSQLTLQFVDEYRSHFSNEWLVGIELLEACYLYKVDDATLGLKDHLLSLKADNKDLNICIDSGIRLSEVAT